MNADDLALATVAGAFLAVLFVLAVVFLGPVFGGWTLIP